MKLVINKKARHDFEIHKTLQAGIVLIGGEVKSLKNKSASLNGSYVKIIGREAWLINAQITPYAFADNRNYDPKRTRKLLLQRKELNQLTGLMEQKRFTIIPLSLELQRNMIKLNIGVGRGKKEFEKREMLKKRTEKRALARLVKFQ